MNITDQLRLWGRTHSAARAAEHARARGEGNPSELEREAMRLRNHADRLHSEIYSSLGSKQPAARAKPH